MLRRYAQGVGLVLFVLGGACMLGAGETNPAVDLDPLLVGGLLLYSGFHRDEEVVRILVRGLGIIYLLAGLLAFVVPALFGMFPTAHNGILLDHLLHLVVGSLNIAVATLLRQDAWLARRSSAESREEYRSHEVFSGPPSLRAGSLEGKR